MRFLIQEFLQILEIVMLTFHAKNHQTTIQIKNHCVRVVARIFLSKGNPPARCWQNLKGKIERKKKPLAPQKKNSLPTIVKAILMTLRLSIIRRYLAFFPLSREFQVGNGSCFRRNPLISQSQTLLYWLINLVIVNTSHGRAQFMAQSSLRIMEDIQLNRHNMAQDF